IISTLILSLLVLSPAFAVDFYKHTIDAAMTNATWATSADIDGDGDIDIVASSSLVGSDNGIVWYENNGAEVFTDHPLSDTYNLVQSLTVGDIDSDGDLDVIASGNEASDLVWFENDGTPATGYWAENEIIETWFYGTGMHVLDMDRDGDNDVLACISNSNDIVWFKNDGSESFELTYIVENGFSGPWDTFPRRCCDRKICG
ncbi:FG-GAP repeat domain-containing protein, partial [Calditrichota bacterium]